MEQYIKKNNKGEDMKNLKITCKNKTKDTPSYVKFEVTENERTIFKDVWEVPVANIRHYIAVAPENEWQLEFQKRRDRIIKKFGITPENIKSFTDRNTPKEAYNKLLAFRRKEYGLTEEQVTEARNKKKRLSYENRKKYQREYRREYRHIERMRKLNPETEL